MARRQANFRLPSDKVYVKSQSTSNDILSPLSEDSPTTEALNPAAQNFVNVTHRQWSLPLLMQAQPDSTLDSVHSPSVGRDRFLGALGADDHQLIERVALDQLGHGTLYRG